LIVTRPLERRIVGFERGTDGFARETAMAIDDRRQRGAVVAPNGFAELYRHADLFVGRPSFEKDGVSTPNAIFSRSLGPQGEAEPVALGEDRSVLNRVNEKHFGGWIGGDARVRDGNDIDLEPVCLPQSRRDLGEQVTVGIVGAVVEARAAAAAAKDPAYAVERVLGGT
jgi:hypothetical protein